MGKLNRSKTQTLTANYTIACMYRDGDLTPNESSPSPPLKFPRRRGPGGRSTGGLIVSSFTPSIAQCNAHRKRCNDVTRCRPQFLLPLSFFHCHSIFHSSNPINPILSHLIPSHQQPTEPPPERVPVSRRKKHRRCSPVIKQVSWSHSSAGGQ